MSIVCPFCFLFLFRFSYFLFGFSVAGKTGQYSLFTEFDGNEIMWHVPTLMPFFPADEQQVGCAFCFVFLLFIFFFHLPSWKGKNMWGMTEPLLFLEIMMVIPFLLILYIRKQFIFVLLFNL